MVLSPVWKKRLPVDHVLALIAGAFPSSHPCIYTWGRGTREIKNEINRRNDGQEFRTLRVRPHDIGEPRGCQVSDRDLPTPSPACSPPVLTVAQPLGRLGFLFPHDHVRGGAGTAVGSTTLTSRPGSSPTRARLWGTPRSGGGATSGRGARAESLANWESPPMAGDRTRKSRGRRRTMAAAAGTSGAGWSLCRWSVLRRDAYPRLVVDSLFISPPNTGEDYGRGCRRPVGAGRSRTHTTKVVAVSCEREQRNIRLGMLGLLVISMEEFSSHELIWYGREGHCLRKILAAPKLWKLQLCKAMICLST
jgi:hypothetical protein